MSSVTTALNDLFTVLFYGSGAWLGLLLLLILILGISTKFPKAGLLMLPISVFLGVNYMDNALGWHALIMWLGAVFVLFETAYSLRKGVK